MAQISGTPQFRRHYTKGVVVQKKLMKAAMLDQHTKYFHSFIAE